MTVKELRQALAGFLDDAVVVIAKDSEGNDFSPLHEATAAVYLMTSTWNGEVYDIGHPRAKNGVPCVVLDPVN